MDADDGPDAAYDLYLDACLAGRAEDPGTWAARNPTADAELVARVAALHALYAAGRRGASPTPGGPRADGLPFERLGDFRLVSRLDEGGMGAVFLARQESLGRDVALKLMRPELRASPDAETRFRREALAVAKLRHPNIVTVHAVGEDQGVAFIAMELVPGRTLDDVIAAENSAGRTLDVRRVLAWGRDLARALASAHAAGIVHRDVKPSNVRITPDDRPMLLDFGLARDASSSGPALTRTFAGSPLYAAPEQLAGAAVDHAADLYGLGATLYQCMTGRVPFAGETMEAVLPRVLAEPPVPPRRLNPAVPRDAETIVLKALEKEPAARYASASDMADDLDAVLASRPIRARPPSLLGRAWRWRRRRPVAAAILAMAAAGAVGAAALVAVRDRRAAQERHGRAAAAIDEARRRFSEFAGRREAASRNEIDLARLRDLARTQWISDEEEARMTALEDEVAAYERGQETALFGVLELLHLAEQLDAAAAEDAEDLRAAAFREKWSEARDRRDAAAEAFWRREAEAHDVGGAGSGALRATRAVTFRTDPPGATVSLLRVKELSEAAPGGAHRDVLVPWKGAPVAPPDAWALRVVRGAGDVERGDFVVALDGKPIPADAGPGARQTERRAEAGGARAVVVRRGARRETTLVAGLSVRTTAAPAFVADACAAGVSPVEGLLLDEGPYVAVFEMDGRETARVAFRADRGTPAAFDVALPVAGSGPDGFVYVAAGGSDLKAPFWACERETTCAEYLEFLNDPRTSSRIASAQVPALFPRAPDDAAKGGMWPRRADGSFALPDDWAPDWPVLGVSWEDAREYAAWRTGRGDAPEGEFALPTLAEWLAMSGVFSGRLYPWGPRFSARWTRSCFTLPKAAPAPVRSYAVDESPCGVYDLAGNAFEWLDAWFDESRKLRLLAGGSWARADPTTFRIWQGTGAPATSATGETGFRLVFRGARAGAGRAR